MCSARVLLRIVMGNEPSGPVYHCTSNNTHILSLPVGVFSLDIINLRPLKYTCRICIYFYFSIALSLIYLFPFLFCHFT